MPTKKRDDFTFTLMDPKTAQRCVMLTVRPKEWLVKNDEYWVGRLHDGTLITVDRWTGNTPGKQTHLFRVLHHPDFSHMCSGDDQDYPHELLLEVGEKLGIQNISQLLWRAGTAGNRRRGGVAIRQASGARRPVR
jgi:hypothetical protein